MSIWKYLVLLITCLHCACAQSDQYELPDFVEVCYRDDPKIADCFIRNIEGFSTKLSSKKRSDLKNFALEPMDRIPFTNITFEYPSYLVGGKAFLTSGLIYGMDNIKVSNVRPKINNPKKFILEFDMFIPHLNIKTDYKLDGNVLAIPVNLKGRVDTHFENSTVAFHMDADVKSTDGKEYLYLNHFTWKHIGFGVKNIYLANDDLVDGYPAISRMIKNIVAASWRQLHVQMTEVGIRESSKQLKGMFYDFLKMYPYDVILPKTKQRSYR